MKIAVLLASALTIISLHAAAGNATYVGNGRYHCSGGSAECRQIEQNNRTQERNEVLDRRLKERDDQERYRTPIESPNRMRESERYRRQERF